MNKIVKKEINFLGKTLKLETGELAMMAHNAVLLSYGETTVLATVVMGESDPSIDFFDLRVHYDPKLYAAGMIKSSKYIKRDGKHHFIILRFGSKIAIDFFSLEI